MHFAILSTFIKLPFVIKILVLSVFEWPFYTCFTVSENVILKHATKVCYSTKQFEAMIANRNKAYMNEFFKNDNVWTQSV